jgi:large subunit ribosomal protein L17
MRHRVKGKKLSRTASHRKALIRSLAAAVLKHKRIRTTLVKAKEARSYVESMITKARKNDLHSRRLILSEIQDKEVVKELFTDVVPKVGDRPGGYTRVIKLGKRMGDAADMAILELVDYNDVANKKAESQKEQREARREAKKEAKAAEDAEVVSETPAEKNK